MTLWEGRISAGMADAVAEFTVSLPFDRMLAVDDLAGSRAHVKGLGKAGILSDSEVHALLDALGIVEEEFETGAFVFAPGDEDVHTAVERRVTELAGDVGAKLHTGRSRNDQVATDLRLWCRRSLVAVGEEIMALQDTLAQRARDAADVYLPGYTHLQRAQPVLLAHHLLAHGWALARDVGRLLTTVDRLNVSPLGAGALAGSSLPLDPDYVAAELGFHGRFENSLDAVSDRDFVAESLFDLALLGVHLSRMGEEIVLWSTEEFGFCTLDDTYATGSSMLPQKKNPDVAELARGKTGRLIGHLNAVLVTLKGLPLAYNRDLQEDKEPLFDAVMQVRRALLALRGVYDTVTWHEERMQAAADGPGASAIDLAEFLVEQGMPFRQAHALIGGLVRESLERHVPLNELVSAHPDLGEAAVDLLEPGVAVTRRRTPGGAGPGPVREQFERFTRRREVDRTRLAQWRPAIGGAPGAPGRDAGPGA
jgi:argininosuccinate lyase